MVEKVKKYLTYQNYITKRTSINQWKIKLVGINVILIIVLQSLMGCSKNQANSLFDNQIPSSTSSVTPNARLTETENIIILGVVSPTSIIINQTASTQTKTYTLTPTNSIPTLDPTIKTTQVITQVLQNITPGWFVYINSNPVSWNNIDLISTDGLLWKRIIKQQPIREPAWSSSGHWIVFSYSLYPEYEKDELAIIKSDGSGFKRITYAPDWKSSPTWSPDGKYISYRYQDSSNEQSGGIAIASIDGKESWIVMNNGNVSYPVWSPDGQKIAYLSLLEDPILCYALQGCLSLSVMDIDGNNQKRLTDITADGAKPSWSPDGQQIAFSSADHGCGDIYIVGIDGNNLRKLTDYPRCATAPSWSPDGIYIAYIGYDDSVSSIDERVQKREIYMANVNGIGISRLNPDIAKRYGSPFIPMTLDWSPAPALRISQNYTISAIGANLNLRESPTIKSKILMKLAEAEIVTILEGPVDADEYYWWRIRTKDGIEGWAVEVWGWYTPLQ